MRIKQAKKGNKKIIKYEWLIDCLNFNDQPDEADYLIYPAAASMAEDDDPDQVQNAATSKRARDTSDDQEEDAMPPKKLKSEVFENMQASNKGNRNVPVDDGYHGDMACRVYQPGGIIYDATLNQTEAGKNANKFYRIQLLQYGSGSYHTWTRWGRVGENGQSKLLGDGTLNSAIREFEAKFRDKTRNKWEDRASFTAKAGKYTLIEINYESSEDEEEVPDAGGRRQSKDSGISTASSSPESKLPKAVASLMAFIFDQDFFDQSLQALNYDRNKMPLGKLSKKTLLDGYAVLKELAGLIGTPDSAGEVTALSNRYFSLIPHAFGRARPPILSNVNAIKQEAEMLESLTDMQLTNDIMKAATSKNREEKLALADRQLQGLGLQEMTPLDHKSVEFKELADYLVKSSGGTHGNIRYNVQDIFRIERAEDTDRFAASSYSKLPSNRSDRALLWHGSRSTNFGGILSQGLRIAPPEAPPSGYMFGKGVYLANMSTKSANYCWPENSGNQGLLLLCEAELGKPPLKRADAAYEADKLARAAGAISTWGVGTTRPHGWKDAACVHPSLKGVRMPDVGMPFGSSNEMGAYLLYDEFICYDIAQVKLKYLIRTGM